MKNKRGMEFNFATLFAIIAGAMILVLAVYGAIKIGNTQRYQTDTEIAKTISILTEPLQAGFAEGSFGKIEFRQETRVDNFCSSEGFGKNEISVSTRSGIEEEWMLSGGAASVHNKYIFSSEKTEGKKFYVFSKPFYFPYKVADLIFLSSSDKEYCFVSAPEEIEKEIVGMRMPNIKTGNCTGEEIEVGFNGGGEINVYGTCMTDCESAYDEGYVEINGERNYYVGSLIYGAVFSENYGCNVERLMYRTSKIAEVLAGKASLMEARGCNTNVQGDLIWLSEQAGNSTQEELISLNQIVKMIDKKQEKEVCGLW